MATHSEKSTTPRSLPTRLLHALLALTVIHQLVLGAVMRAPRGATGGDIFWQAHQFVGIASLSILFGFWAWTMLRRRETPVGRLFPWLSARGRADLRRDANRHLAALRRLRLPNGEESPVASAVHGLGLLTATLMAMSGCAFFVKGVAPDIVVWIGLNIHGAAANLLWAYLIAHGGLAMLHELTGQRVLRRMAPIAVHRS